MTPNEMLSMIAQLRRERNESREKNAKLRDITERALIALHDADLNKVYYLRAELEQIKGAK